jgi:hypothetical protein
MLFRAVTCQIRGDVCIPSCQSTVEAIRRHVWVRYGSIIDQCRNSVDASTLQAGYQALQGFPICKI